MHATLVLLHQSKTGYRSPKTTYWPPKAPSWGMFALRWGEFRWPIVYASPTTLFVSLRRALLKAIEVQACSNVCTFWCITGPTQYVCRATQVCIPQKQRVCVICVLQLFHKHRVTRSLSVSASPTTPPSCASCIAKDKSMCICHSCLTLLISFQSLLLSHPALTGRRGLHTWHCWPSAPSWRFF